MFNDPFKNKTQKTITITQEQFSKAIIQALIANHSLYLTDEDVERIYKEIEELAKEKK